MNKLAGIWRNARAQPPEPFRDGIPYQIVVRWQHFENSGLTTTTPNQLADRVKGNIEIEYEWLDDSYTEIVECLQRFIQMHESGLLPNRFTYEDALKALNKIEQQ